MEAMDLTAVSVRNEQQVTEALTILERALADSHFMATAVEINRKHFQGDGSETV